MDNGTSNSDTPRLDSDTTSPGVPLRTEISPTSLSSSSAVTECPISALVRLFVPFDQQRLTHVVTARAADLLFVKVVPNHTNDLFVHCQRESLPFVAFDQFLQVRDVVAEVVSGKATVADILAKQKN